MRNSANSRGFWPPAIDSTFPRAPNGSGGYGAATTFLDISGETLSDVESGLLGIALDPSFAQNRFMYLYQVRTGDARILRVTASTNFASASAHR